MKAWRWLTGGTWRLYFVGPRQLQIGLFLHWTRDEWPERAQPGGPVCKLLRVEVYPTCRWRHDWRSAGYYRRCRRCGRKQVLDEIGFGGPFVWQNTRTFREHELFPESFPEDW